MNKTIVFLFPLLSMLLLQGCTPVVVATGTAVGLEVAHDRRNAGTVLEDRELQVKAYHELSQRADVREKSDISIDVYHRRLLLTGSAQDPETARQAAELVGRLQGVTTVYNEIVIGDTTLRNDTSDAYITSKAKLSLFDIKIEGFDPTRVKVSTSHGSVYLMGLVTTGEADAVTEKVRYLRGVKRVVKLFEYIEPAR